MFTNKIIPGILFLTLLLSACATSNTVVQEATIPNYTTESEVQSSPVQVIEIPDSALSKTFVVEGMTCVGCAYGIEYSMQSINGVYKASLDYKTAQGSVTYDDSLVTIQQIVDSALPYVLNFTEQ